MYVNVMFFLIFFCQIVLGLTEFCPSPLKLWVSNLNNEPLVHFNNTYSVLNEPEIIVTCLSRLPANMSFEGFQTNPIRSSSTAITRRSYENKTNEICYEARMTLLASSRITGRYKCKDSSGEETYISVNGTTPSEMVKANFMDAISNFTEIPMVSQVSISTAIDIVPFPPHEYTWEDTNRFYTQEKFNFTCNASSVEFNAGFSWEFGLKNGSRIPATVFAVINETKEADKPELSQTVLLMFNYSNINEVICSAQKRDSNELHRFVQQVNVEEQIPPQMNTTDENIEFDYGEKSVKISCLATGVPNIDFRWERNGKNISEKESKTSYPDENSTSTTSSIDVPMSNEVSVTYTCIAQSTVTLPKDVKKKNITIWFGRNREFEYRTVVDPLNSIIWIIILSILVVILICISAKLGNVYFKTRKANQVLQKNIKDFREGRTRILENDFDKCPMEKQDPSIQHPCINKPYPKDKEIPKYDLTLVKGEAGVIGVGHFGQVRKGRLKMANGNVMKVAVKISKQEATDEVTKDTIYQDFLRELKILNFVHCAGLHPNIVQFFGGVIEDIGQNVYIVVEYCKYHSFHDLKHYLTNNMLGFINEFDVGGPFDDCPIPPDYGRIGCTIRTTDLIIWSAQIASGMAHLAEHEIVHRDLAARNVLLDKYGVAKITDFGLSRKLVEHIYVPSQPSNEVPVRWFAPEALIMNGIPKFSVDSDIWAFGVTMWEIFTFGDSPYPTILNDHIRLLEFLKNGNRLGRPKMANDALYEIMKSCWEMEGSNRPRFLQLQNSIMAVQKILAHNLCNPEILPIDLRSKVDFRSSIENEIVDYIEVETLYENTAGDDN